MRTFLRRLGPIVLGIGLLLTVVGIGSFFVAMFRHSGPPVLFVCAFIGMPSMFVGTVMCMFGFMGSLARYVAAEQAPVAKDTINYMAEGTQGAVKTFARAAAEGIAEGLQPVKQARRQPGDDKV